MSARIRCVLSAFLFGALALVPSSAAAQRCINGVDAAAIAQAVATLNAQRASARLPGLSHSPQLSAAALRHACDMAASGLRGHRGSDGSSPRDRVRRAGYRTCLTAENVAWGQRDVPTVMAAWIGSPPHLANIMHQRVRDVGLAGAGSGRDATWVMVLARPC